MNDEVAIVVERELLLLSPAVRLDPERVLTLLHPDFVEYGSSGRTWDRSSITAVTAASADGIHAEGVETRRLGPHAVLVTYRSHASGQVALRRSIWVREGGKWLLLFHQGTPLTADDE